LGGGGAHLGVRRPILSGREAKRFLVSTL